MSKPTFDSNKVFFTSDIHFGHKNVIEYEDRGTLKSALGYVRFKNTQEMDNYYIKKWNKKVKPDDIVFYLGDFAFGNQEYWLSILERLNGTIHLIRGNHDCKMSLKFLLDNFESVSDLKEIYLIFADEKISVTLCHYPLYVWNKLNYGAWHLFGHVHSKLVQIPNRPVNYNVGVDIWGAPVSAIELATKFYQAAKCD